MLIKEADDKSKRLALLESLKESPLLDSRQKEWLDKECWAVKEGVRGERDAAHYLDNHFAADHKLALIHDLRLEVEGETAQIDHLLISRGFVFYLLETKQYNGDLHINEFGEFSVSYGNSKPWGLPSPLEQSRRHQNVLRKMLERLGISGRIQKTPEFKHVVLVNPKSRIHRPPAAVLDTSNVIKADQFASWREKYVLNEGSVLGTLSSLMNMRTTQTVKEWAQMLVRQHRPGDLLALPGFMAVREVVAPVMPRAMVAARAVSPPAPVEPTAPAAVCCANCGKAISAAEHEYCAGRTAQFNGRLLCMEHQKAHLQAKKGRLVAEMPVSTAPPAALVASRHSEGTPPVEPPQEATASDPRKRKLVCCTCDARISFPEGKFCWSQEQRFGGLQYCREHQAQFR